MAKVTLSESKPSSKVKDIKPFKQKISNTKDGTLKKISNISPQSSVTLDINPKSSKIRSVGYSKKVKPKDILPFKLKITNITIEGITSSRFPGIGAQVIGYSNYIL